MKEYKINKWYRGLGYYMGIRSTQFPDGEKEVNHLFKKGDYDTNGAMVINKLPISKFNFKELAEKIVKTVNNCDNDYDAVEEIEELIINVKKCFYEN